MKLNIIDYITKQKKITQKELAIRLGVTPSMVSQWKKENKVPYDREKELIEFAGLFGDDLWWCALTKTEKKAQAWMDYFEQHLKCLQKNSFLWSMLRDMPDIYVSRILSVLDARGVNIPDEAPEKILYEEDEPLFFFDSLVSTYLENLEIILDWWYYRIFYLFDYYDLGDSEDISGWLREFAYDAAFIYCGYDVLEEVGVDISTLDEWFKKSKDKARDQIIKLCRLLIRHKIPFEYDFFDYINKDPEDFSDDFFIESFDRPNSIEKLLPYAERYLIADSKNIIELLGDLHIKIDTLLSAEDIKGLDSILDKTRPSLNKYLIEKK